MDIGFYKNLFCLLLFAFQIHSSSGDYGFFRFKPSSSGKETEVCAAYNPQVHSFPEDQHKHIIAWKNWHQTISIYPSYGCSALQVDYKQKYIILQRGNCTFEKKAQNVQRANGIGVIVVSSEGLDVPGVDGSNDINISMSVITFQSYSAYSSMQDNYGDDKIRLIEYTPLIYNKTFLDFNAIAMWCLAVATLAVGAWCQGSFYQANRMNKSIAEDANESESEQLDVSITPFHAIVFFCMCSVSILLMYFFFDYLVYVIIVVFCYASALSLFDVFYSCFKRSACFVRFRIPSNNIPFLKKRPPYLSILLFLACASFSVTWAIYRKSSFAWMMQDILGCGFCIYMIKTIKLPSFKVCTILLVLFFIYDIFYVFISPLLTKNNESIMVHVATGGSGKTKEELPMLFKLPKFALLPFSKCGNLPYSMLGYGDVILPGLQIGFCSVWDAKVSQSSTVKIHSYYIAGVASYGVGLVITFIAMYLMMTGQPALLYLVPCCLLSTLLVALKRNEFQKIWNGGSKEPFSETQNTADDFNTEENHRLLTASETSF